MNYNWASYKTVFACYMAQSALLTTDALILQSRPPCPRLTKFTEISIFLLGFLCLIVPSGYSYGAVLLCLGGIYVLIKDRSFLPIDRYDKYILGALLVFGVDAVFNWLWHGFDGDLDRNLRFILAIPIFFLVYRARPSLHALWLGLALGALGTFVFAVYQKFSLGIVRVDGFTNAIQFGNLAMLQGVLCLAGLGWAASLKKYRWMYIVLLGIAAVAGLATSVLSGSRGGWVGLPIILLIAFFTYRRVFSIKSQLVVVLIVIMGATYVFFNPQLGVQERIKEATHQVNLFQEGEVNTSVGLRFEMWRGAYKLIQENPFLGWGIEGYEEGMAALVEKGEIHAETAEFNHSHNDFIDRLAKHGAMGLFTLLLLYLLPLRAFSIVRGCSDLSLRAIALAGVLLICCYINFGLTQSFLRHNSGVMVFVTYLVVIAGYFKVKRLSLTQSV